MEHVQRNRALPLIAALAVLLVCAPAAFAITAGHNGPTKKLEAAFKVAQFERAHSTSGCYPGPPELARVIGKETGQRVGVAGSVKSVARTGAVHVIRRGSRCDHLSLALRAQGKLWILDSTAGTVEVKGRGGGSANPLDEAGGRGPLRALTLTTKTLTLTKTDEAQRGEVLCPRKTYPLGGGMTATPPLGIDGEGIYPHSYERLGAQRGWHVNPVLIDPKVLVNPSNPGTIGRKVTLQVVCGKGLVPASAPRKSAFVRPGETATATARCRKGQVLISGGFQRSNFRTPGGNYVTESRAVGPRAWRVTGRAFGNAGGELTSIAYCDRSKRPLLSEVSASTPLPAGQSASSTTPPCPPGHRLTSGGFSFNGSHDAFFAAGFFNPEGTWSATGYGYFGPAPGITAYGYCLRAKG